MYQQSFTPARTGDLPRNAVLIGVLCAETQAEAERLHTSIRLFFQRAHNRDLRPLAEPLKALHELADTDNQSE